MKRISNKEPTISTFARKELELINKRKREQKDKEIEKIDRQNNPNLYI